MLAQSKTLNFLLVFMFVITFAGCDSSGTNVTITDVGNAEGIVSDAVSGNPISGVTVQIGDKVHTTGIDGVYTLLEVEVGSRIITANKSGYDAYSSTVTVIKGTTVNHAVHMTMTSSPTGTQPPIGSVPTGTQPPIVSDPTNTQQPPAIILSSPTNLQASAISSNHISLSWAFTPPSDSNYSSGIAIARKDGAQGTYKIVGSVASDLSTYEDLGLTPATAYSYKIYTYSFSRTNGGGLPQTSWYDYSEAKSGYSNEVSATTSFYTSAPQAPSGATASAASGWAVNISWADNSSDEDGFVVERSLNGTDFAQIDTVSANVTSYKDRQVDASKPYWYRVKAFNTFGSSSYTGSASVTTPGISPTLLSGSIFNDTTWTLANSPYYVTSSITVFPNVTLTIEPGVEIRFANATSFEVRGTLNAIGTASLPIVFTSASPDTAIQSSWNGIHIANSLGGNATLRYVHLSYSSGMAIDCCWQGGPVEIYDSLFSNNATASIGYAGWITPFVRTTFSGNATAVGSADKKIYYSHFKNNNYGFYATERISVYYSVFEGHSSVALYGGRGSVKYCTISGNNIGVQGFFEGFTSLTYNTIMGNQVGIITGTYDGYSPAINYNNIYDNVLYNAKNNNNSNKDLTNNWWGATFSALIDPTIYDAFDNASLGIVNYTPVQMVPLDIIP